MALRDFATRIARLLPLAGALGSLTCGQILALPDRQAVANYECASSSCACVAGFGDCDADLANGCEVKLASLANDAAHCGGCNVVCASGRCSGGQCMCASKSWPVIAPAAPEGGKKLDLVFALRSITMLDASGKPVGYDLDRQCTGCACPQSPSTDVCIQGKGKNIDDKTPDGIDNAAAAVLPLALAATGDKGGLAGISNDAGKGNWSLLFRLRDYNGEPNDRDVRLAIYTARAFDGDPCNGPTAAPKWNGSDRWPIRSDSLKGAAKGNKPKTCGDSLGLSYDAPRFEDVHAFVSGGVLTATWPDDVAFYISGSSEGIRVELHQAAVTATISEEAGQWRLGGGLIAGGWPEKAMFRALAAVRVDNGPLCSDDTTIYPGLKALLCDSEDVRTDKGGPTSLCDAISFAFAFEGKAALLGSVIVPEPLPAQPCAPAVDPANDSCQNL